MTLMPHLSQPISAPHTPVTATHALGMERCRSSEPVLGNPFASDRERKLDLGRGGRGRDIKATSLLFKTVPSAEQIQSAEKGEWHHIEGSSPQVAPQVEQDLRMDIDGDESGHDDMQDESAPTVWGMPRWGCENERGGEVRKGVRLVGMEEVRLPRQSTTSANTYSYPA
jgi:dual specificity MAP kinase phosphatase